MVDHGAAQGRMPRRRAYCNYCNYLLDEPEVSLPLAPLVLPELMPPLVAPAPVLSEDEPEDGAEVPPVALEPYCFTQSSRSVPVMPRHWFGSDSLELPALLAGVDESLLVLEPPALELAGALGVVAVSEELLPVDCAHAALASSAAATAAARDLSIMRLSLCE
jgi:hypothetical protein